MKPTRRVVLSGVLSALMPASGWAQPAEDAALRRTLAALAAVRERRSTFTEEKAIPELDLPLPSEGTLRWSAPDTLEKITAWPIQEQIRVEGNRLSYERADRGIRGAFALEEQPEMLALVQAVRGTLAGDLPALLRHYEVRYSTERDGSWRLALTPLSLRLRAAVQSVVITGEAAEIRGVETEGHGGITRMRVAPAR